MRVWIVLPLLFVVACGADQKRFEPARRAGTALSIEIARAGGASPDTVSLLRTFQTEVALLDGPGDRVTAYREAAADYADFVRFRALDLDAVNGKILLMGSNTEAAKRQQLPVETIAGQAWVDSRVALKASLTAAEAARHRAER